MTMPTNALQAAIYTRLTSELSGVGVYDHVPQNAAFPYIDIGDKVSALWHAKDKEGWEFRFTFHIWTKGAGTKANQTIMSNIYDALHLQHAALNPTGFNVVLCENESTDILQDPSVEGDKDHYYHGIAVYRILIEPTS